MGIFFVAGLYNVILFMFRKKEKSYLYFSIVNFLMIVRMLLVPGGILYLRCPYFEFLEISHKIEYIDLCLIVIYMIKYFKSIYTDYISELLEKSMRIISYAYIIFIAIMPFKVYLSLETLYYVTILLSSIYISIIIIKVALVERDLSIYTALGAVFFTLTIINDVLYYKRLLNTKEYLPLGIFVFITIQIFIIAIRYSSSFNSMESLQSELILMNKLKKDFLESASKKVKTPLTMISEITENLKDKIYDENILKELNLIASNTEKLLRMAEDLEDFSKIQGESILINIRVVDISQIFDLVYDLLKEQLKEKSIDLRINISKEISFIYADEVKFKTIIQGIIENLVNNMNYGRISIFAKEEKDFVEIHFQESFEEDDVFDIHSLRKEKINDLNMSVVKTFIKLQQGNINFNEDEVVISMPKVRVNLNGNRTKGEEFKSKDYAVSGYRRILNPLGKIKILIADDDFNNIKYVVSQISSESYSITTVSNGMDALKEINNSFNKYDLIIVDSMMPKMSGFEFCKQVRKQFSTFELPILMIMKEPSTRETRLTFEVGATDYIIKPFSREELLSKISTLLTLKEAINHALVTASNLEAEKYNRKLGEKLKEITGLLSSTLDLKEVMRRLLESLKSIVAYDCACVMLMKNEDLYVAASCNYHSCSIINKEQIVNKNNKLIKDIIEKRKPIIINKLYNNDILRYNSLEECDHCSNAKSWIGIPLMFHDTFLGILVLEHNMPNMYEQDKVDIAISFAAQASIAIENAKLFGEVKHLAITDALTGINNRRYFLELSEKEFANAKKYKKPLCAAMIDVDYFKRINDTYGHGIGDMILKGIVQVLKEKARSEDIIGRYGGEEFFITFIGLNLEEAYDICESIRTAVENKKFIINNEVLKVTISIGLKELKEDYKDIKELLEEADKALYNAKESGRNKTFM